MHTGTCLGTAGSCPALAVTPRVLPAAGPSARAGPTGPCSSMLAKVLVMLCSATDTPKITPEHWLGPNLCGSVQTPLLIPRSVWVNVRKVH